MLDAYAKELGLETLLLETLIDSHRSFRSEVLKSREELNIEFERIRKNIEKYTRESINHGEYVATRRLAKMTVSEFIEFITDYKERHQ